MRVLSIRGFFENNAIWNFRLHVAILLISSGDSMVV
jgi:hypothetical protein